MRRPITKAACLIGLLGVSLFSVPAEAGGAWIPEAGSGTMTWGVSRKTADESWNAFGDGFHNSGNFENHDFRYGYLDGEVGLGHRLSARFLVTYLYGLEGPDGMLEKNAGLSDAWVGLKYGLTGGSRPQALELEVRTPVFYDLDGPYDRHLHNEAGEVIGNSPEWRGLLKHDVTLAYLASRSLAAGSGWWNARAGYTWREGAPADQVQLGFDYGRGVAWRRSHVKAAALAALSLGNDSERTPSDRFGSRADFNFNDASMLRASVSWITPLTRDDRWRLEVGYGQWLWGESARQYQEPFVSLSRGF